MIGTLFMAVAALLLHPVHETYCEVQWNDDSKCVEVALRLDMLDEQWIDRRFGLKSDNARQNFLRKHLLFDPVKEGKFERLVASTKVNWVGRKEEGGHTWWFFEVRRGDGRMPQEILTRLLFDRETDFRHRVQVLDSDGKVKGKAIDLKRDSATARLNL